MDGIVVGTYSGDTQDTAINDIRYIKLSGVYNKSSYWDDIAIHDDSGVEWNDFQGDFSIQTLAPNAVGNSSQWTPLSGDNYTQVDDSGGHDGDTTYVETNTVTNKDTYGHENLSVTPSSILAVVVNVIGKDTLGGTRGVKATIRSNTSEAQGPEFTLVGDYSKTAQGFFYTDPDTLASWTDSDVNGAEFGYELTTQGVQMAARVTQEYVEVIVSGGLSRITQEYVEVLLVESNGVLVIPAIAEATISSISPTTLLNSIIYSPTLVDVIAAAVDPTIPVEDVIVTPTTADIATSTFAPVLILESIIYTPTFATSISAGVNPSIIFNGMVITPASADVITSSLLDNLVLDSVVVVPTFADVASTSINPIIILGSITYTPIFTNSIGTFVDPTVIESIGSIALTPPTASATSSAVFTFPTSYYSWTDEEVLILTPMAGGKYINGKYVQLLDSVTSVTTGDSAQTTQIAMTFQVSGTFVGTVAIQGTLDGTNWVDLAYFSADGVEQVLGPFIKIRARVTAYTSGTINAYAII